VQPREGVLEDLLVGHGGPGSWLGHL
jgi:hypothetical protein